MYVRENNAGTTSCTLLAVFRVFTAAADRYCEYSHYYCHCVVFRGSVLLLYWGYDSADTFGLALIIRDSIRGSALKIFSVLQVFRVSILLLLRVHIFACILELPYCSYSQYTLSSWAFSVLTIYWPPVLQYSQYSDNELFSSIFYSVSVNIFSRTPKNIFF